VYQQLPQPPSSELVEVFRAIEKSRDVSAKLQSLRELEVQAKVDLARSLRIIAGQLRAATRALQSARLE
jgi:hypothetical protein